MLSCEAEKPIFRQNVELGGTYSKQLLLCDAIAQDFCQIPILLSIECRLILFSWCGRLQNNGSEIFGLSVLFQIGTQVTTTVQSGARCTQGPEIYTNDHGVADASSLMP